LGDLLVREVLDIFQDEAGPEFRLDTLEEELDR